MEFFHTTSYKCYLTLVQLERHVFLALNSNNVTSRKNGYIIIVLNFSKNKSDH